VLFYGKCKDGKSIPPNAFLMELKARQTRHGWEPSMLLRFVKSCLRGKAALWWEGCILSYGDDQDQGPADNYVMFKVAFKQHYGIGTATNNLCWADTFRQRSDEDIREYFSRSTAELENHLKESAPLDIWIYILLGSVCLELLGLGLCPSRRGWGICPARARPSWIIRGACPLHDLTEVRKKGRNGRPK
jgi:hypothetical protein